MGSVEDDISAMFDSSSHGSGSLAGVMEPVMTSSDIFASFASHHHHQGLGGGGGGLARASSMSQAALSQHPPQTSSYSAAYESFMPTYAPAPPTSGGGAGLHRYHSAPSAFLQSLAEDYSMGNNAPPLFPESGGLASITELDVERSGSGNSITEFEQFLSPDSDFSRRAALSAQTKPENSGTHHLSQDQPSANVMECCSLAVYIALFQNSDGKVLRFEWLLDILLHDYIRADGVV